MISRFVFASIFVTSILFASSCKVDSKILNIIALVESHPKKEVGYPYLISFNNKKDAIYLKKILEEKLFIDDRTIDCLNSNLCTKIASFLVAQDIVNLDLGAFQINYKFHKMRIEDYFSFKKSYYKACNFLEKLIKENGYSWETIAMYHSKTPFYNYKYLEKISQVTKGD